MYGKLYLMWLDSSVCVTSKVKMFSTTINLYFRIDYKQQNSLCLNITAFFYVISHLEIYKDVFILYL